MRTFLSLIAVSTSFACSSATNPKKTDLLASVKILAGNSQQGTVGTALASPITIQTVDSSGRPIANLPVAYGPSDGTVTPTSVFTDSTGKATTSWTLGAKTGLDTLFVAVTQSVSREGPPIATVIDTIYATANP